MNITLSTMAAQNHAYPTNDIIAEKVLRRAEIAKVSPRT
jgi:hypothetical protein